MTPQEIQPKMVICGPNLEPLLPTSYLRFVAGQLRQWHEASCTIDGCTHTVGEWVPVPSYDWE